MLEAGFTCILSKSLMNTRTNNKEFTLVDSLFFMILDVARLEPLGLCVKKTIRWIVFSTRRLAGTEIHKNLGRQANSMQGRSRSRRSSPVTPTILSIHKGFDL